MLAVLRLPRCGISILTLRAAPRLSVDSAEQDSKDGSTVHLELDISGLRMRYVTADNLGVFPSNDAKEVATIAKRLGVELSALFKLEKKRECPVT